MADGISYLHASCIKFAGDLPAIALSSRQIERDVARIEFSLISTATYPDKPTPSLGDTLLSKEYNIAYSVFIKNLRLNKAGSDFSLAVAVTVTVHPVGSPGDVIKYYEMTSRSPSNVRPHYDVSSGWVSWRDDGTAPDAIPHWYGSDSTDPVVVAALKKTNLPEPQAMNFDRYIQSMVLNNTASFLRLLSDILPKYNLQTIVPWLRLKSPVSFDTSSAFVIAKGDATIIIPGTDCEVSTKPIPRDPEFPGKPVPEPIIEDEELDFVVYAREGIFSSFFSKLIAVPVNFSDSLGSIKRLDLNGPVTIYAGDLKEPIVGTQTSQGPLGTFVLGFTLANMDLKIDVAIAGPCGDVKSDNVDHLLASAQIKGHIDFDTLISKKLVGSVNGKLVIASHATFTAITNGGDPVVKAILEPQIYDEANKGYSFLEAVKERQCRWTMLEMPASYLQTISTGEAPAAYAEGFAGVSGLVGVGREQTG